MEKLLLFRNDDTYGKRNFNDEKYQLIRGNITLFFISLVKKAERDGFDIDNLLEKPDALGHTVFGIASNTSKDIVKYILSRPNIDLGYINPYFVNPWATTWPEFTEACFDYEYTERIFKVM